MNSERVPQLPDKLIVGYANWNQCDDSIVDAVKQGVNVVIWFSINLGVNDIGESSITNGPNWDCVAEKVEMINDLGLETIHLISIGGWNSPHPDTTNSAEDVFISWDRWNRETVARPEKGFFGFHGFDWDIEGNDDPASPYNHFTVECLDLMGRISQLAKQRGYIVAMAPAESYLDPMTAPYFDRSLQHDYDEWEGIIPPFLYHGRSVYAYLLSRYGQYVAVDDNRYTTFDFVTVQLYEGYSHVDYNLTQINKSGSFVISEAVRRLTNKWIIDFSTDQELNYPVMANMQMQPQHLVIGLANGWAGDGKFPLVFPDEVGVAYNELLAEDLAPRGFAFWNILDEGRVTARRPHEPLYMAAGLNSFLRIRKT